MNERNIILHTTVILWDDRANLSILGIYFDLNYEIFILLTTLKLLEEISINLRRMTEYYFKIITKLYIHCQIIILNSSIQNYLRFVS